MLNRIRTSFSVKDLENFSGVKAHTIRAWERRYNIFTPDRTEGNQRLYDLQDLQKMLSIGLLIDQGHRISKIAQYNLEELPDHLLEIERTCLELSGRNREL